MRLEINENFHIDEFAQTDSQALIKYLNDLDIYNNTLAIPNPYTEKDAEWWLSHVAEQTKSIGRSVNWCIRNSTDGELIGGIGYNEIDLGKNHVAEIGYWLAKPFWGKGIMSAAVQAVSDFGFEEFELYRITAGVFFENKRSARVLEKAGFNLEAERLKNRYRKDGKIFDGRLYAKAMLLQ